MPLVKAVITGAIGGIAVPFAIGGAGSPFAALLATMPLPGPAGTVIPWSWPLFCLVTLISWALLHASRA